MYLKSTALLLTGVIAIAIPGTRAIAAPDASWAPRASERLIKLPGDFLKKAVDNDFAKSGLATAMMSAGNKISLKKETLADLQAAVERADGDLRLELQYQFLAEKKRYITLMKEHQKYRSKRATAKVRLYQRLLRKLQARGRANTPAQATLIANQTAARERFNSTVSTIDTRLFRSGAAIESRYAREYAKNLSAIDTLSQAINAHPMNQAPVVNGRPVTQSEYLRQLISTSEAEVALVDQEHAVLGFMAKLVSLDALALSEGITGDGADMDVAENETADDGITSTLDFFVSR